MLHEIANGGQQLEDALVWIWSNHWKYRQKHPENPFSMIALKRSAISCGWDDPIELSLRNQQGAIIRAKLRGEKWKGIAHALRVATRTHMWKEAPRRWDMIGSENGVDLEASCRPLIGGRYNDLEKGLYRRIVTGSILTPSRLEDDSSCRICNDGSRNSLGHRA